MSAHPSGRGGRALAVDGQTATVVPAYFERIHNMSVNVVHV